MQTFLCILNMFYITGYDCILMHMYLIFTELFAYFS